MVLIENISLQDCRLCQLSPGVHEFRNNKKLINDIYLCTRIKVNDKSMDFLPRLICEDCENLIKRFSSFLQQIRKVDQCLKKILKNCECKENSEESFKCDSCPAEFINREILDKHRYSHETNVGLLEKKETVDCPLCKAVFTDLEDYGKHTCKLPIKAKPEKLESDDEVNKEEEIYTNFSDNQGLSKKRKKYICSYKACQKVLSSPYTLKTHLLTHQGKRSFLCVTCGKGFITKNSLTCHEKIHLEVKGYNCKLCNIGFSVRSNLRAHEKNHHEGIRFYCSQCTKVFFAKSSLERHEKIHIGIKEFPCQSCSSAFYTKKELSKHQRYHQGVRSHKCDECFKTFFERHHLIIHRRTHTGERPYVCKIPNCGKAFTESQKLKRHHNAKHAQS